MAASILDDLLEQLRAECQRLQQENHNLKFGCRRASQVPRTLVSQKRSSLLSLGDDGDRSEELPPDRQAGSDLKGGFQRASQVSRASQRGPNLCDAGGRPEAPRASVPQRWPSLCDASGGLEELLPDRLAGDPQAANVAEAAEAWPAGIGIREVFTRASVPSVVSKTLTGCTSSMLFNEPRDSNARTSGILDLRRLTPLRVLHPNASILKMHDFIGMICVLYEIAATPYAVAWQIALEGPYLVFTCVVSTYWLCDLVLAFNTGFYNMLGQLRMVRKEIVWNYLRRTFFIDLSLVASDWSIIALSILVGDTANASYMIVRVSRSLKAMKIIRLMRLAKGVDSLLLWRVSHGSLFIAAVCKIILATLLAAHVLACVWYILGQHGPTDTENRWTMSLEDTAGPSYEYMSSMHFVVAQMTLGSTDIMPVNTAERLFSASILVFAFLTGSALTSYVGAMVMEKVMLRRDRIMKIECLRDFLRQHEVAPKLAQQVQRQAICRLASAIPAKENNVEALQMVSTTLRLQLCFELRMPHLKRFPLFQVWKELDITALELLCKTGVENEFLAEEDDLFLPGTLAQQMYFTVSGILSYVQQPGSSMVTSRTKSEVHDGTWICEMALWTHWYHVGRLIAQCTCHMLFVSAAAVENVLLEKPGIVDTTKTYARNFHDRITIAIPPAADWPSDIQVPHTEFTDLLSTHVELKLLDSTLATRESELTGEQIETLKSELERGACRLQKNSDGKLLKIVALVTLSLCKDGMVLAKVGTWNQQKGIRAKVQLPGRKRQRGEPPHETMTRLLEEDFADFGENMKCTTTEHQCQAVSSATCGLDATYLRYIQNAVLVDEMPDLRILRSKPRGGGSSVQGLGDVALREVYAVPRRGRKTGVLFYAWLSDAELNRLNEPRMVVAVTEWLMSLEGLETISQATPGSGPAGRPSTESCPSPDSKENRPSQEGCDNHGDSDIIRRAV